MAVNISMERAGRDPMVERIFGQYIYDLEEDLISVMEEAIQSGEILAERSASKLASLFLATTMVCG